MSSNLIPIKAFLGKYYEELNFSSTQEKYKNTKLDTFFDQRFYIQNNKVQMVVDPTLSGLTVLVLGNEIRVSKTLYDHPSLMITNSIENATQITNPKSLYNPDTFSTVSYLMCQNHTVFLITGEIDEPIYVKYKSEYETFYSSILVFEVAKDISIEIVEEIESLSALNSVVNYIIHPGANIKLTTFYQNRVSGISFMLRNIIAQTTSGFDHMLFGAGSSNIIDETKLFAHSRSKAEFLGIINSHGKNFHSILSVSPVGETYKVNVDYRNVVMGKADVTFFPVILGQEPADRATISVSEIKLEDIPVVDLEKELRKHLMDLVDRAVLERMTGGTRYYQNKSKFLHFP